MIVKSTVWFLRCKVFCQASFPTNRGLWFEITPLCPVTSQSIFYLLGFPSCVCLLSCPERAFPCIGGPVVLSNPKERLCGLVIFVARPCGLLGVFPGQRLKRLLVKFLRDLRRRGDNPAPCCNPVPAGFTVEGMYHNPDHVMVCPNVKTTVRDDVDLRVPTTLAGNPVNSTTLGIFFSRSRCGLS